MKLKETEFYHALCWAIKKYFPDYKAPNPNDKIIKGTIEDNSITIMTTWTETEEGQDYWSELHDFFTEKYEGENEENYYYFILMMKEYKKTISPQLELGL